MRILLVANYLPDGQESMARFSAWLSESLTAAGHEVTVTRPLPRASRWVSLRPLRKWAGYVDKYLIYPFRLYREIRKSDLVHICDHSNAPYIYLTAGVPTIITCHDLIAIRAARADNGHVKVGFSGKVLQRLIANGICRARYIACVSDFTLSSLKDELGPIPAHCVVVQNPLAWPYSPMPLAEAKARVSRLLGGNLFPYMLHVGGNQWYKNRPGVIRLFNQLKLSNPVFSEYRLVMVGKMFDDKLAAAVTPALRSSVISVVGADNEDLRAFYTLAETFLFPSLEEGFGWPIIEAQACGAFVVTSDRPPMSQIAGRGAVLVNPESAVTAAEKISASWNQRDDIRSAGILNAKNFSPDVTLNGYLDLYALARSQSLRAGT